MEYCYYGSVADMMDILGQGLADDAIAQICHDALQGLQYLHDLKKIHRDIKPANFLITKNGTVKLGDFGIATSLNDKTRHHKTLIGTPHFLAPEIVEECGYNEKVDIWALGISIIEMAELYPPYYGISPMRVLNLISQNPPPKFKDENAHSYHIQQFLASCLNKSSQQRPSAYTLLKHPFVTQIKRQEFMELLEKLSEKITLYGGIEKALEVVKSTKTDQGYTKHDNAVTSTYQKSGHETTNLEDLLNEVMVITDDRPPTARNTDHRFTNSGDTNEVMANTSNDNCSSGMDKPTSYYTEYSPFTSSSKPSHFANLLERSETYHQGHDHELDLSLTNAPSMDGNPSSERIDNLRSPITLIRNPNYIPTPSVMSFERIPLIQQPNAETNSWQISTYDSGGNEITDIYADWKGLTAGGCHAFSTWRDNMQVSLHVLRHTQVRITLEQIAEEGNLTHIGLYIFTASETEDRERILDIDNDCIVGDSARFSLKKTIEQVLSLEPGWYVVFGCTYQPAIERRYLLSFERFDGTAKVKIINGLDTDWKLYSTNARWMSMTNGGTITSKSYRWCDNPKYLLSISHPTQVFITISSLTEEDEGEVGVAVFKTKDDEFLLSSLMPGNILDMSQVDVNNMRSSTLLLNNIVGNYLLIPYNTSSLNRDFRLSLYSFSEINLSLMGPSHTLWMNGSWGELTAGGSLQSTSWIQNPQYLLKVKESVNIIINLVYNKGIPEEKMSMGMVMVKTEFPGEKVVDLSDILFKTDFTNTSYVSKTVEVKPGDYVIIPMTILPNLYGKFSIVIHELLTSSYDESSVELHEIVD